MTDGQRGPYRSAQGRTRSEEIRLAALRLFAQRGYLATTMEDIGRAAGIRGPSIYRHYQSKQQLLYEIMTQTMSTLIAEQKLVMKLRMTRHSKLNLPTGKSWPGIPKWSLRREDKTSAAQIKRRGYRA